MNLINKIANVSKYLLNKNKLYHQKGKQIFIDDNSIMNLASDFFGEFYVNNGELIMQSNFGEFEYKNHKYKGYYNYLNTQEVSFLDTETNEIYQLEANNEKNRVGINKPYHKFNGKCIVNDNKNIYTYSFPNVNLIWQFDLSMLGEYKPLRKDSFQKYEVIKFLGVWHDELLVICSNGLILCLDINNGQETRRFHKCPPYVLGSKTYDHFDYANSFVYDDKKEILFALQTFFYMEVNLQTGDINITDLKEDMAKNQISLYRRSSGYAWDDTHIYTIGEVANHESGMALEDRCLLAYNRSSQNIDWRYIFENDSINTDIPQLSGDKLYQLSANNTLHIFQKEDQTIN